MRTLKSYGKLLGVAVMLLTVTFSIQGCGKKSRLKSPEGATYPRQYPAP